MRGCEAHSVVLKSNRNDVLAGGKRRVRAGQWGMLVWAEGGGGVGGGRPRKPGASEKTTRLDCHQSMIPALYSLSIIHIQLTEASRITDTADAFDRRLYVNFRHLLQSWLGLKSLPVSCCSPGLEFASCVLPWCWARVRFLCPAAVLGLSSLPVSCPSWA